MIQKNYFNNGEKGRKEGGGYRLVHTSFGEMLPRREIMAKVCKEKVSSASSKKLAEASGNMSGGAQT